MSLIACLPAHVGFDLPRPQAGVVQLSEAPHHLHEVMARVLVVAAAGVRPSNVLAPVGALPALAHQPQPCVFPLTRDGHGALVLGLGVELNGIVPDALSVRSLSLG